MQFSVGFVVAALALSAAASPVDARRGTKIALNKRGPGARDVNGVASAAWMKNQLAATKAKYARGFSNYERNTGSAHPLAYKRSVIEKRGTGSNDLTDAQQQLWYGTISVGTPPVEYKVDYDTGSSDLFLPGPNCSENCDGKTPYDPSQSSTSQDVGQDFQLKYGDGSTVSGEQYTDTVTISGLTATQQTLGAADTYSTGFGSQFPADGLMGMAFESISDYNANPVFQTLMSQGQTDAGVFAFKLAQSGSSLYLGGTDSSDYTGDFTYVPVTQEGYWQVDLDGLSVAGGNNRKRRGGGSSAIIDTGTTLLVGDSGPVQDLVGQIQGSGPAPEEYGEGSYMAPCDNITDLTASFGGKDFTISKDTVNFGQIEGDESNCLVGIAEDPQQSGFWIMGDVFLQNVYTAFDVDNSQVGFANLA